MPAGRRCFCWLGVFFCGLLRIFFFWNGAGAESAAVQAGGGPPPDGRLPRRCAVATARARAAQGEGEGEAREEDGGLRCQRGGGVAAPARPGGAGPAPLRSAVAEERGVSARGAPTIETLAKKKLKGAVLSRPGRGRRPRHVDARANIRRSSRGALPRGELRRAAGFWPASRPTSPPRLAGAGTRCAGCGGEMLMLKASDSAECGPNSPKSVHFEDDGDMYPEMQGAKFTHNGRKVVVTRS